jgi:hypothetical protein
MGLVSCTLKYSFSPAAGKFSRIPSLSGNHQIQSAGISAMTHEVTIENLQSMCQLTIDIGLIYFY